MLAASVPMIALFVVTGSTYAFAQIAGRLQGQDHFDERISTPSVNAPAPLLQQDPYYASDPAAGVRKSGRSEEHTSELQSRGHLVCRLLLEKKKKDRRLTTW